VCVELLRSKVHFFATSQRHRMTLVHSARARWIVALGAAIPCVTFAVKMYEDSRRDPVEEAKQRRRRGGED
jgi:hypothetical protein